LQSPSQISNGVSDKRHLGALERLLLNRDGEDKSSYYTPTGATSDDFAGAQELSGSSGGEAQ